MLAESEQVYYYFFFTVILTPPKTKLFWRLKHGVMFSSLNKSILCHQKSRITYKCLIKFNYIYNMIQSKSLLQPMHTHTGKTKAFNVYQQIL